MRTSSPTVLVLAALLVVGGCDGGSRPSTGSASQSPAPPAPSNAPPSGTPAASARPPVGPVAGTVPGSLRPSYAVAPPARDGVDLEAIAPASLERTALDVNPFTSEASLVFTRPAPAGTAPGAPALAVRLSVKVHDDVATARAWLLTASKAVTGKLTPAAEPVPCDQGFVATDANGGLAYALLCRSNVTCVARVTGATELTDEALRTTLTSWATAIDASPELEAPAVPSRPRLGTIVTADVARSGHPALVTVPMDPSGAPAAYFAYEASDGASLVASKLGPMLYASKPGLVKVRVAAATRRLGCSVGEALIAVGGD